MDVLGSDVLGLVTSFYLIYPLPRHCSQGLLTTGRMFLHTQKSKLLLVWASGSEVYNFFLPSYCFIILNDPPMAIFIHRCDFSFHLPDMYVFIRIPQAFHDGRAWWVILFTGLLARLSIYISVTNTFLRDNNIYGQKIWWEVWNCMQRMTPFYV